MNALGFMTRIECFNEESKVIRDYGKTRRIGISINRRQDPRMVGHWSVTSKTTQKLNNTHTQTSM